MVCLCAFLLFWMPVLNSATTTDDQNVLGAEIHCTTRRTIVIVFIEIIYCM